MSGRRAKALRRQVYGEAFSPRHRLYKKVWPSGSLLADPTRRRYQAAKVAWIREHST